MTAVGSVPVSMREAEVLDALADRLTNNEIADRLVISVRTVEAHVSALLRKLGAANRRELADIARQRHMQAQAQPERRLPATLNRFVGRADELAHVRATCEAHRLVTIAGPAGVGKTRLAIESAAARADSDDASFVDFAAQDDVSGMWGAIATGVGAPDAPGRRVEHAVLERLRRRPALLVLDNCEHVLDAAAEVVAAVLAASPTVQVLATSREPLGIPGEVVILLAPLPVPAAQVPTVDELGRLPSVQLFVDRALATSGGFRLDESNAVAIASICRQLDGIPLGLELAAAQLPALSPEQIDERLRDRFGLLRAPRRGPTARYRALDAAVGWSWELLETRERALLDRLCVLRGDFTLDAAETVASGPPIERDDVAHLLVRLVRKSLVVAQPDGGSPRYRLLETMREFGWRRLESSGELPVWRERHRQWVFERMQEAADGLACGVVPTWLDAMDAELDNMNAALEWSVGTPERAAEALPVVRGLEHYWMARGVRRAHGVRWSTTVAERATGVAPAARVESLLGAVLLVMWSDLHAAATLAAKATQLADDAGDPVAEGYAALAGAWVAAFTGDVPTATGRGERAAALIPQRDPIHAWTELVLGVLTGYAGDAETAARRMVEVAATFSSQDDPHMYGAVLSLAADFEAVTGAHEAAWANVAASQVEAERSDCASCLAQTLASMALLTGAPVERLTTARRAVSLAHDIAEPWGALCGLEVTVPALVEVGHPEDAALLAGATRALRRSWGMVALLPGRAHALANGEEAARAVLGDEHFAALVRDGENLDYASAIAHALG